MACASFNSNELVTICIFSLSAQAVGFRSAASSVHTMHLQATIGLGLLTLVLGAIAVMGTHPENRVPYAFHIALVTSLAYFVSRLT